MREALIFGRRPDVASYRVWYRVLRSFHGGGPWFRRLGPNRVRGKRGAARTEGRVLWLHIGCRALESMPRLNFRINLANRNASPLPVPPSFWHYNWNGMVELLSVTGVVGGRFDYHGGFVGSFTLMRQPRR